MRRTVDLILQAWKNYTLNINWWKIINQRLASNWVYGFVCKGKKFPTRMLMVQSTFFNVVGDLFEKCFIDLDSEDVTQFQSGSFRSRDTIFMSTVCPKINLL